MSSSSSPTRLRLVLLPPFEERKYLLPLPTDISSISGIKKWLVKSLNSVSCLARSSKDIVLEVDGFELLGACGVDIIRDGDVVAVRLAPGPSRPQLSVTPVDIKPDINSGIGKKRKRTASTQDVSPAARPKIKGNDKRASTAEKHDARSAGIIEAEESAGEAWHPKAARRFGRVIPPVTYSPSSDPTSVTSSATAVVLAAGFKASDEAERPDNVSEPPKALRRSGRAIPSVVASPSPAAGHVPSSPSSSSATSSFSSSVASRKPSKSSSSSESSSETDSDSSSSSSSVAASPGPRKLHKPTTNVNTAPRHGADPDVAYPTLVKAPTSTSHVPPGQGKASTKDRNARRKIAKAMRKAAAATGDVVIPAIRRTQPTGPQTRTPRGTTTVTTSELPVPKAMANRNKKKGFLKEMMAVQGTKTVFDEDGEGVEGEQVGPEVDQVLPSSQPVPNAQAVAAPAIIEPASNDAVDAAKTSATAKVPVEVEVQEEAVEPEVTGNQWFAPSSIADNEIPVNLFVTSVQHRHMPFRNRPSRKAEPVARQTDDYAGSGRVGGLPYGSASPDPPVQPQHQSHNGPVPVSNMARLAELAKRNKPLPHDTTPTPSPHQPNGGSSTADSKQCNEIVSTDALFDQARRDYIKLPALQIPSAKEDMIICWPEVELNLTTFSPELVYKLARVVSSTKDGPGRGITTRTIVKPSAPREDGDLEEDYVEEDAQETADPEVEVDMVLSEEDLSDESNKYRVLRGAPQM